MSIPSGPLSAARLVWVDDAFAKAAIAGPLIVVDSAVWSISRPACGPRANRISVRSCPDGDVPRVPPISTIDRRTWVSNSLDTSDLTAVHPGGSSSIKILITLYFDSAGTAAATVETPTKPTT